MPDLTAKRTLVKSPPELWEELSEVERLAKHLDAFGEIRITRLEPEHTVAWEGEHASGTVSIEPSGWGTKVTLHAELPEQDAAEPEPEPEPEVAEPQPEPEPEPEAITEPEPVDMEPVLVEPVSLPEHEPEPKRGFWGWLFRSRTATTSAAEPEPLVTEPEPLVTEPEPEVAEPEPIAAEPEPEPVAIEVEEQTDAEPEEEQPAAEEQPDELSASLDPDRARLVLDEALDALGAAHHRPFSRG